MFQTKMTKNSSVTLRTMSTWRTSQVVLFILLGLLTGTFLSPCVFGSLDSSSPWSGQGQLATNTQNHFPTTIVASKVKILSFNPFMAHISDFITKNEREYLLRLGNPLLKKSYIRNEEGSEVISEARTSSTAFLPERDPIVLSIAQRAADFQGFLSPKDIDVQITSYDPGQQYKHHYDWYPPPRSSNRVSTIFAILKSTCDHCGTEFPFINVTGRVRYDNRWCDVLDCTKELLTTKNIEGSALFWLNLNEKTDGRADMLHAGLPAVNGNKVGLNIWTDIDLEEVKNRGLFGGQSTHYFKPSKEFLENYGLVHTG